MALAVYLLRQLVNYVSKRVIQLDSVAIFMLISKTQITFPVERFALKRAIMLHSVTSYKLIVVRKTGEPWGRQARSPRKEIESARKRSPPPTRRSQHADFVNTCSGIFPDDSHGNDVDDYDCSDSDQHSGDDNYVCQGSEISKCVYLPVTFNKLQVAALLDSDSTINIMSEELYHTVPNSCKSGINSCNTDTVKLANNQSVVIVGTGHAKLSAQGEKHNILVYILKQTSQPLILGTS